MSSSSSSSPLTPGRVSGASARSWLLAAPLPSCTLANPSSASTSFLNVFPATPRKGEGKKKPKKIKKKERGEEGKKQRRRRTHILMSCQAYSLHIPIRLTDKWSWPGCQADLNQCPFAAPSPQPSPAPPLHYLREIPNHFFFPFPLLGAL